MIFRLRFVIFVLCITFWFAVEATNKDRDSQIFNHLRQKRSPQGPGGGGFGGGGFGGGGFGGFGGGRGFGGPGPFGGGPGRFGPGFRGFGGGPFFGGGLFPIIIPIPYRRYYYY